MLSPCKQAILKFVPYQQTKYMRFLLILLLTGCCLAPAYSQITIQEADLPVPGDSFYRATTDNILAGFAPHKDTLNSAWDISWISSLQRDTDRFVAPMNHEFGDSFPESNLVWLDAVDGFDAYAIADSKGLNAIGFILPEGVSGGRVRKLDNPINYMPVPFTYGDTFVSGGAFDVTIPPPFEAYIYNERIRDMDVMNYGTLKMNDDSVYEVIMVEVFESQYDSTVFGANTTVNYAEEVYYEFYTKNIGLPLARCRLDQENDVIDEIEYVDMNPPVHTGLRKTSSSTGIYPNPATNILQLSAKTHANYVIYSMDGRMILSGQVQNDASIDISPLESGSYILELQKSKGLTERIKFSVQ